MCEMSFIMAHDVCKVNTSVPFTDKNKNIFEKMSEYVGFSPPPTYFLHIRCDQ